MASSSKPTDTSKYVRYTSEQVEVLEKFYMECSKPTSSRRQQLIRECPMLANIEPKQIKVWFQNRRCRDKQKTESSRLQTVNRKLSAMNKLLMEENDRLQKQVSKFVYENGYMKQQLINPSAVTTDLRCESVVQTSLHQQQQPTPQHPHTDVNNPAGLLALAEKTLTEFLAKATGTAVNWVQMPGMKPGPDSIGIIAVSHNCHGVAARACGLVNLEPMRVARILKDRISWFRDCRCLDVLAAHPTRNDGIIELIYMQTYAPTTMVSARDFWMLRYTTSLEDGSVVICERSLTPATGGPVGPPAPGFVRAEMLPSGYLIRPCEGSSSIIHIVDHVDLDARNTPEVLRPLYESPQILAQRSTIAALRHIRQIAQEMSGEIQYGVGKPTSCNFWTFSQRMCRGFNDAVNGFADDGWSLLGSDGVEDVTIAVNSSPNKLIGFQGNSMSIRGGVLSAKASMLLQFLEVIRLEGHSFPQDDVLLQDMYLLQLCSGLDENAAGAFAQLVFSPFDESFAENVTLLPSGFRVIPLDPKTDDSAAARTLDLASSLESGPSGGRLAAETTLNNYSLRSVLTIAFQFAFENHYQDSVVAMARQYVRSIVGSVQRVVNAISPSRLSSQPKSLPGSPEAVTLARWICRSYRFLTGIELLQLDLSAGDALLKQLWRHSDAIMCCSLQTNVGNRLSTLASRLLLFSPLQIRRARHARNHSCCSQDIMLDKILNEAGVRPCVLSSPRSCNKAFVVYGGDLCVQHGQICFLSASNCMESVE
ncbi:hypothetical protein IFM89_028789 [Coptis chinensis]|uniref:Uncharacterized protein n=1 Tax=Coptis chinensis TaxID=261450 RepID=A0A835LFE8_9MAGN|nr:hypothetical protein IFM89_028789 [Coptis chinensis]